MDIVPEAENTFSSIFNEAMFHEFLFNEYINLLSQYM